MDDQEEKCSIELEKENLSMFLLLPPEVMETIIKHMDGVSIARSEQVCTVWRDIIRRPAEHNSTWKRCCEKEISRDVRMDIVNAGQPSWYESEENINWKVVFKSWYLWQNIKRWPYLTRNVLEDKHDSVSCAKMTGNFIVTGHTNGFVYAWCYGESWEVARHQRAVTDLGLIINSSIVDKNKFRRHEFVVSTSVDHDIHINLLVPDEERTHAFPIVRKEHNAPIVLVRTFADVFAVLSEDQKVSVWQIKFRAKKLIPEVMKCYAINFYADPIEDISIYGTKAIQVTALTHRGVSLPVYSKSGPMTYELVPKDTDLLQLEQWENLDGRILRVFLWRYGVSIILTDEHYMYIRINGHQQRKYNTMPYLHTYPVIAKLYGPLLILGTESGMLYMYRVNKVEDLLTLKFNEPYWKCATLTDPVVSIDIGESQTAPKLVAATKDKVVSITFLPNWFHK